MSFQRGGRWLAVASALAFGGVPDAFAQTLAPAFSGSYSVRDVGIAGDVAVPYGGLLFKAGDPDTLLVAESTGDLAATIRQLKVKRDARHHVTGFAALSTPFADAPGVANGWGIDGGMDYGPNGVLFYTSSHEGGISQIKPGGTGPAKQLAMASLGIDGGGGGLLFVPAGFAGVGRLKLSGAVSSSWYDLAATADGSGTYNLARTGDAVDSVSSGQGLAYIKGGSAAFPKDSVLIASMLDDRVVACEVDSKGDPVVATARDFLTDYYQVTGLTVDPTTGDFLIATSDLNTPRLIVVGNLSVAAAQVRITAPADGASFTAPATIPVTAEASQTGGSITKVNFFQGTTLLGFSAGPAFGIQADLPAGQYTLTAVAIDGGGNATTSAPVHVSVVNHGPTIALVYPTNNAVMPGCSNLAMVARVVPGNAEIVSVAFFDGPTALGVSYEPFDFRAYQVVEPDLDGGTRTFSVVVTDANGVASTALATNVVVQPLALEKISVHFLGGDGMRFCFRGVAGTKYVWEKAPVLASTGWVPFLTNTVPAGRIQITNHMDVGASFRLYRARREP